MVETRSRLNDELSTHILDLKNNEQQPTFVYSELLRHVLLHLPHNDASKQELFAHIKESVRQSNSYSKTLGEKFEETYTAEQAISWYTEPSFLYWQLNQALREQDINYLYSIRHYLVDLHNQLKNLHLNFDPKAKLYRGIMLQDFQLTKLEQNTGKLIHFSEFLSTSMQQDIAKGFIKPEVGASTKKIDNTMKAVLFHIDISSCDHILASEQHFIGCIKGYSQKPTEDEVLFSPTSVFRLKGIRKGEDAIHNIDLELTNERDESLKQLFQSLKKEIVVVENVPTNLVNLAKLIRRMGKFPIAIDFYRKALEDKTYNQYERYQTTIFTDLSLAYRQIKEYDKAMEALNKASESVKKGPYEWFDRPYRMIANNKAMVLKYKKDFKGAHEWYVKLCTMEQAAKDVDGQEHATTLSNLGCICLELRWYDEALTFFQKALSIQTCNLLKNHPEIGRTYTNMAACWSRKGDHQKAEECAMEALNIKSRSMLNDHQSVAYTMENLAMAQKELGRTDEAYNNLEAAGEILQQQYPANDLHRQALNKAKDSIEF